MICPGAYRGAKQPSRNESEIKLKKQTNFDDEFSKM